MRRKPRTHLVWMVVRPGHGEFDGMPISCHRTRRLARKLAGILNSDWDGTSPRIRPFRVKSMDVNV